MFHNFKSTLVYRAKKSIKCPVSVFFFFPVNIKSAREPRFLEDVHGYFFGFTGTFSENSRASGCVHGHFFGRFHGHFFRVHGQKKVKCSRTLFDVHGHILIFKVLCSRALVNVHGHFCQKK